jgi:phosphoglycolate phosphatase-like HAD superfamily hydrolase
MDGVLVDSGELHYQSWLETLTAVSIRRVMKIVSRTQLLKISQYLRVQWNCFTLLLSMILPLLYGENIPSSSACKTGGTKNKNKKFTDYSVFNGILYQW